MQANLFNELSKTKQLQYELIQEIKTRHLKPHDVFLSEREIIDRFNINRTTVRNTLANLVEMGFIYRINGKGTFVAPKPKIHPIILVSKYDQISLKRGNYAIIEFFGGLSDGIKTEDMPNFVVTLRHDEFLNVLDDIELIYKKISGVIFYSEWETYKATRQVLSAKRIPSLYYGADMNVDENDKFTNTFVYSQQDLVNLAMDALYRAGHRKIGVVFEPNHAPRLQRFELYQKWLTEHNLTINPDIEIQVEVSPKFDRTEKYALLMENLTKKSQKITELATAFFCVDDVFAMFLMNTLARLGYQVPEDISIVSIDNYPTAANMITPLSSVEIPFATDSITCLRKLSDLKDGKITKIREKSTVSLVERDSIKKIL